MSKAEYVPPTGAPPNWSQGNAGYVPQQQPSYNPQTQDRGYHQQPGYGAPPPQQGYYQQPGYGAPPPQQGYYQQPSQQPMYVQQQTSSKNDTCLMACLAALCVCYTLDVLF
ncbi:hypothetical protein JA1_004537 [Spathaspora sp. JA1]|nr:hypothetical protein JA1_004537 [Spathaspora sp. JA1]